MSLPLDCEKKEKKKKKQKEKTKKETQEANVSLVKIFARIGYANHGKLAVRSITYRYHGTTIVDSGTVQHRYRNWNSTLTANLAMLGMLPCYCQACMHACMCCTKPWQTTVQQKLHNCTMHRAGRVLFYGRCTSNNKLQKVLWSTGAVS